MSTAATPGREAEPKPPDATPASIPDEQESRPNPPEGIFERSGKSIQEVASWCWGKLPTLSTHYWFYLVILVAAFALWQARNPVTTVMPFQIPDKASPPPPFSGETVANVLQDRLTQIYVEIEKEKHDKKLHATDMHSLGQPGLQIPTNTKIAEYTRSEVPSKFAVEVKGLSYQSLIGSARAVLGTQTTISGDVILKGGSNSEFILVARTEREGPWQSGPQPLTGDGLDRASTDLAERILESREPELAGIVFLNEGQVQRALAALRKASDLQPASSEPSDVLAARLAVCAAMEANEFYQGAIDCYQKARDLKSAPAEEIDERLAQARWLYGEQGNRVMALQAFEDLAHKQNYSRALLDLAKALDDTGEHGEALGVYEEFFASREDIDPRTLALIRVGKATSLSALGKHEEALTEYEVALKVIPGDELILVRRGVELADAGDLDAGIRELRAIVGAQKATSDVVAFAAFQLGKLMERKGDWKQASEVYRTAIERRPEFSEGHNRLANSLAREGNLPEALSEFSETAKLSSTLVDRKYVEVLARQWLGNRLQSLCDYPGATAAYQEVIRMKPDYRLAHSELGHVLQQQGQIPRAIQEYEKALDAGPNELDREEWVVMTLVRLGEALRSEGPRYAQESVAQIRAAVMIDPESMEARLALGKALSDAGNYEEAASAFKNAVGIDTNNADAHYGLAFALEKLKREVEATAECGTVTKLRPGDPVYRTCRQQPMAKHVSTSCKRPA